MNSLKAEDFIENFLTDFSDEYRYESFNKSLVEFKYVAIPRSILGKALS